MGKVSKDLVSPAWIIFIIIDGVQSLYLVMIPKREWNACSTLYTVVMSELCCYHFWTHLLLWRLRII